MLALTIIVRYVFLDRDGVLNRKMPEGVYVGEWAQFVQARFQQARCV